MAAGGNPNSRATKRWRVLGFKSFKPVLVPGVVGHDELKSRSGVNELPGLVQWKDPAVVGQRMDHDDGVGTRLDDLVEVTDRAKSRRAASAGRPARRFRLRASGNGPSRSLADRSSWQATVTSGRPRRHAMCSMKRVLPQPVGPFSITGRRRTWHRLEHVDLVADSQVIRRLQREDSARRPAIRTAHPPETAPCTVTVVAAHAASPPGGRTGASGERLAAAR